MENDVERLRKEIEELENQIAAHPFGGLFDKKRADQMYQKLKKRRKELAKLEGSAGPATSASAEAPKVAKDAAGIGAPPVIPEARKAAAKKSVGATSKAKTGTPAKGKKTTASKSKAKASGAGGKTSKKPSPRKATAASKGKAKTGSSPTARKTTTPSKKKK